MKLDQVFASMYLRTQSISSTRPRLIPYNPSCNFFLSNNQAIRGSVVWHHGRTVCFPNAGQQHPNDFQVYGSVIHHFVHGPCSIAEWEITTEMGKCLMAFKPALTHAPSQPLQPSVLAVYFQRRGASCTHISAVLPQFDQPIVS